MSFMDEEKLILAVQKRPVIYDKEDRQSHSRDALRATWESIAKEVGCEASACRHKWGTMRDYFLKKYREYSASKSDKNSKRRWYLYNTMSFLIPYYPTREPEMRLLSPDDQPEDEDNVEEEASPLSPASVSSEESFSQEAFRKPQQSRKRKKECSTASDFSLDVLKSVKEPKVMDGNELFFRSLLPSLKKLNDIQTMEFRMEVQSVVLKFLKQSTEPPNASPSTSGYVAARQYNPELHIMAMSQNLKSEEY